VSCPPAQDTDTRHPSWLIGQAMQAGPGGCSAPPSTPWVTPPHAAPGTPRGHCPPESWQSCRQGAHCSPPPTSTSPTPKRAQGRRYPFARSRSPLVAHRSSPAARRPSSVAVARDHSRRGDPSQAGLAPGGPWSGFRPRSGFVCRYSGQWKSSRQSTRQFTSRCHLRTCLVPGRISRSIEVRSIDLATI
jgi:hypothetical protein